MCLEIPMTEGELALSQDPNSSSSSSSSGEHAKRGEPPSAASCAVPGAAASSSQAEGEASKGSSSSVIAGEAGAAGPPAWALEASRGLRMLATLALDGVIDDVINDAIAWGMRRGPIEEKGEHFKWVSSSWQVPDIPMLLYKVQT